MKGTQKKQILSAVCLQTFVLCNNLGVTGRFPCLHTRQLFYIFLTFDQFRFDPIKSLDFGVLRLCQILFNWSIKIVISVILHDGCCGVLFKLGSPVPLKGCIFIKEWLLYCTTTSSYPSYQCILIQQKCFS